MGLPVADKESLLDAHRLGASNYVLHYVQDSIEQRRGHDEGRKFYDGLQEIDGRFKTFKATGKPMNTPEEIDALLDCPDGAPDVLRPYMFSALAFQLYRESDFDQAVRLLQAAKACDKHLIEKQGMAAFYPHLLQGDHNLCRILIRERRTPEAKATLNDLITSLLKLLDTRDLRLAVSLELMGHQLVSYQVGLVEAGRLPFDPADWPLEDFPTSHTLANIALWIAIKSRNIRGTTQGLADKSIVPFGILRKPAQELLSHAGRGQLDA